MTRSTKPIKQRFSKLLEIIKSERFLKMLGLSGDVPFFICPYSPKETPEMYQVHNQLVNQLGNNGVKILEINLYDLVIEILKKEDDWSWYLENEVTMTKDKFKKDLQSILDIETVISKTISEKTNVDSFNVIFITGVGEIFPYIRTHTILTNLQKIIKNVPLLLFFPGEFNHSQEKGSSLKLFNIIENDKYYRAFNIDEYNL